MRRLVLLFLLLLPTVAFAAGPTATMTEGQVLRGRFVQERHLKGFNSTFRSEGHFVLAPGKGLIWRAEKPFVVSTVVTAAGIVQAVDGNETMRLTAARLPFLSRLYDMLSGALAGDWHALESGFTVTRSGDDKAWQAVLTLRAGTNAQAIPFRALTAKGGRFVDSVEMTEASEDTDTLTFADQVLSNDPLTADEATALASPGK